MSGHRLAEDDDDDDNDDGGSVVDNNNEEDHEEDSDSGPKTKPAPTVNVVDPEGRSSTVSFQTTQSSKGTSAKGSSLKRLKSKGSSKKNFPKNIKHKVIESPVAAKASVTVTEIATTDTNEVEEEEVVEPVIPDYQPEVTVFEMIKKRIVVAGKPYETLTDDQVFMIQQFITNPVVHLLVAYNHQYLGFCINHEIPTAPVNHLCYFIKNSHTQEITSESFLTQVQYGTLKSGHIESLLRAMMGIYSPMFFEYHWPNIIKNDFSLHLHRFLASLTDTRWKLQKKTVLYVTKEGMKIPEAEAAKNKELVKRLEISVIHWARQIKDVLAIQDALEVAENSGPLDEIKFWRDRCADISGITEQLEQEGVKRITQVLELAKSSYVAPFVKLSGQIKVGTLQAESNLKFLNLLEEPCLKLASAKVSEIPKMLPGILKMIRIIWVNSDYYNTREKLTAILKKLSNEIIRRCCAEIDLNKIFDGYVHSGRKSLLDCIACCEKWKDVYEEASKLHHKFSSVPWILDHDAIFAQVDAFIKRCYDMLEVCEAHNHFARQEEGYTGEMPQFAGHKYNEIIRDLNDIKIHFEKCHRQLRGYKRFALDAMNSSWHDAYRKFLAGIRDLEVMMQNTIITAFKTVKTVQAGVELLEVFVHLSSREVIYNAISKLTTEMCRLFIEELNAVRRDMASKDEYRSPSFPKYAGSAHFARMLKFRAQRTMTILEQAYFLPKTGIKDEVRVQFKALLLAIDEYIQKTYAEWKAVSAKEPLKLLDIPLMYRLPGRIPKIDINFKAELLKLIQESTYWDRLHFDIPVYAQELYARKDHLKLIIELVLLIVRDHNRITSELSVEEQGLFKERLNSLERYIQPGLKRITWVVKETAEIFLQECRLHCVSVQKLVDSYKMANLNISNLCVEISEYLLVKINHKMIYENLQFEADQVKHRDHVIKKLKEMHESILATLRQSYEVYKNDGLEVQLHWYNYTDKMDKMVEEAFRLNIKWSLQELLKAMNGDGKSAPNPLFRLKVILEKDRVEFSPTLFQLASIVEDIGKVHLIRTLSGFSRLPDLLSKDKSSRPPIFESIRLDEEINKILSYIAISMQNNAVHLQNYMSTWDTYREIWEINKDAFIGRYQKLNPQNSSFDADIARYNEVANNVQMQETILNIQFVLLDCSSLKSAILSHCQEWQNKFTTLLRNIASDSLQQLMHYLASNSKKVSQIPQSLDQLVEGLQLWDKLKEEAPLIEKKFPPLMEQFVILDKYSVAIPTEVRKELNDLPAEWDSFMDTLLEAESMLKKQKEIFKVELLRQAAELKQQVSELIVEFDNTGPFTSQTAIPDAFVGISSFQQKKSVLKELEQTIRHGLNIFNIEHPPSKDLAVLEKDLENIKSVWDLTDEWMKCWDKWKTHTFDVLKVADMEETSSYLLKNLTRLSKAFKDRRCEIVDVTQSRVDQVKRTLPLITDLKNPAMRPRHWAQIQDEMDRRFDHTSPEFTLEKIIDYGFDRYSDFIAEVSYSATKELAIEQALKTIAATWQATELDIIPYRDKGMFKLGSVEEIFVTLEENQMLLTTMKASRFVKAFEKEVDHWERTVSHILETTEMLMVIQKHWMYMENIFIGDDIRRQLPQETARFDSVNGDWKEIMGRLNGDRNALRGTHYPGLLHHLNEMNENLETIRRSLDLYLETKRNIFPRFYFLSNDTLLEILGQSRNPESILIFLKHLFDNIKTLKMAKVGPQLKFEAAGMFASDGEYVEFNHSVSMEGQVEVYLGDVERMMRVTLKECLRHCRAALKKSLNKRDKWIKDWPGQVCIIASQIQWTQDVMKALGLVSERGDIKALKNCKKKQRIMLNKFSETIRTQLSKIMRLKIVSLVTIEVHARDVIEKLMKANVSDVNSFDWLSQLRYYWEKEFDDCIIRQTTALFFYSYEYLGNSGRLVITPLTDRCQLTISTALNLYKGGCLKGPASTGKTETVKDFGKALGLLVLIVNCSEGLDFRSMGRLFAGLAQTGAWGSFDEMNRINIEVLSVIAQQIVAVLAALASEVDKFVFEGQLINLVSTCGFFITMNPGYSGRHELPENLKCLFRPMAMVVPDTSFIAEIFLFSEGFGNTKVLSKKTSILYSLATQQLSKQDHYDFLLRGVVAMLKYAGKKKRMLPHLSDDEILCMSVKEMNLPKLVYDDLALFNGIVSDLFPDLVIPTTYRAKLISVIEEELAEKKLQATQSTVTKVFQLMDAKSARHSTMLVGATLSGKTTVWHVLEASMNRLNKAGEPFPVVRHHPINPKALSVGELFGEFDKHQVQWNDGIFSTLLRGLCLDEKPEEKWVVFDGPVDSMWVESMNSLMDDNKVLTLINGDRVTLSDTVSLLFEVEDLAMASPATVSRACMVYCDYRDLGVMPYLDSWLSKKTNPSLVEALKRCIDVYLIKVMEFKATNCKEPVPISELNGVISLCRLFDSLFSADAGAEGSEYMQKLVQMWFQFCLIWSVCSAVDEDGRKKLDNCIREIVGTFPNKDTVYEYYVDTSTRAWAHWEEKLRGRWKYKPSVPFYKLNVPTVDTVRYQFLCTALIKTMKPVLMVGAVGTGKTLVIESTLAGFDKQDYNVLTVKMSAQTSSGLVQNLIESRFEKHTKGVFVPIGGKKLISFMDDLNMPAKDQYGYQPPLELMKQWLDYGFWFHRSKRIAQYIKGMLLVSAMGPPGGGRMVISNRLQSRFNLINMTFPQDSQIKRIFGSMITQKLQTFEEEVRLLSDTLTQGTIEMYQAIVLRFLPTPTRIHYLFNLRDISRVFEGLLRADQNYHDSKGPIIRLWMHECYRVFSDRLIDQKDLQSFSDLLSEKLGVVFEQTFNNLCPNKAIPMFGDFMNKEKVYEQLVSAENVKTFMIQQLQEYNNTPKTVHMDLVLFRDAIEHISRIVRVIRQPHGNVLLIGINGSGRQSLTRLASFLCDYAVFQIEVSDRYGLHEFREDMKRLYSQTGLMNKPTVFLFNDVQAVEKTFFEDVNCILSSGEVANLYRPEELEEVKNTLSPELIKEGLEDSVHNAYNFMIDRVRANLHVVLCMSPLGEDFRNSIRMFPALVNNTAIDWFHEWPAEALLEVADKYMFDMVLGNTPADRKKFHLQESKAALSQMFMLIHKSVAEYSIRMFQEIRRFNCVSPTNYLELVTGYKELLFEKATELTDDRDKLRSGLSKIDETREKVEKMSVDLEEAKIEVAACQKECEEFLKTLVQQKREADEQQKSVAIKSERIKEEEVKCQALADIAQADLDEAMPALDEANKALESLNKRDMTEIKSYGRPPVLVEKVMESVMILRGSEPTWAESKKQLGDQNFLKQLMNYDKDNITDRVLRKIGGYVAQSDFHPDIIGGVSAAAKSLCMWVRAMEMYGRIYRVVEPKRIKLNAALAVLAQKREALAEAKAKLAEVEAKLLELKLSYDEKLAMKEELRRKADLTELMLDRAQRLMSGLHSERVRWEEKVEYLEGNMGHLIGDVLIAAAFLSYLGPFLTTFRDEIVLYWKTQIEKLKIPCAPRFNFCTFMAKPTLLREWNIQGLPRDEFSTENGVIVTRSQRWPFLIDPQGQGSRWIKNMESELGLKITDIREPKYMKEIEFAIQRGLPVLLTNVLENLDPSLNPILNKSLIRTEGASFIKIGSKEIEYNEDFRIYLTTKLGNPLLSPQVLIKVAAVNFAVMSKGLEAQLLGLVVRKERPELEEQKDNLVCSIAAGKKKLDQCEDQILRLLNETKGSLLDDAQLVDTLQLSKSISLEVTESVAVSEQMEVKIDAARECYRPCAEQASILFFILNDMGNIDPMYQFSLDTYSDLFSLSIEKSQRAIKLDERIANLNEYHLYAVYKYVCRGLFEKHKLIFSFQMCIKLLEYARRVNIDEYNFFLRGGIVIDRENQMDNPCTGWLSDESWDNITELDKLTNFHGIITSFEQYSRDWYLWYISSEPENTPLPGEWDKACNELQRMLVVRSLRPDRVSFCATSFIVNNLGQKFTEPPLLDMMSIIEDSSTRTPLIFIVSPGSDPRAHLQQIAEVCGMASQFNTLSLGQGQASIATRMLQAAVTEGRWLFLANCHLSLSWMPCLSQLVDQMQVEYCHPNFRLWLSSLPHPDFPISVLQAGVKITTEHPKGLKAGMKRLYSLITEQQFQRCHKPEKYKKLLFALCFFHTILLERKKFKMLGWNIMYEFNDADFEVSEHILVSYLDTCEDMQWDAVKYLIANINYGGHVTDDWDRRLLMTYVNDYFCESVFTVPFYKLSSLPTYYIPKDGPLASYKEYVTMLPNQDIPEVFGQHPNAEISSQIQETRLLFDTLLSLQPLIYSVPGDTTEDKVLDDAAMIMKQLPDNMDYEGTAKILSQDPTPLNSVLLQEMQRYNALLDQIRDSLHSLERGIQGLTVMTQDLEIIFTCIFDGRVPPLWGKTYPSAKPLSAWAKDLVSRVDLFDKWASSARPPWVYWLSAFTFPSGFLTAVLQMAARQHQVSVDSLTWEFIVQTVDDSNLTGSAKDGVYVKGFFLEGAGWDKKNAVLIEASSVQLVVAMPTIQFKPVESKKKGTKRKKENTYLAPCYYFSNRMGTADRSSFIVAVELKGGDKPGDHWAKRGAALLMSLDY